MLSLVKMTTIPLTLQYQTLIVTLKYQRKTNQYNPYIIRFVSQHYQF